MAALGDISREVKTAPVCYSLTLGPPTPPPVPVVGQIFPYVAPAS